MTRHRQDNWCLSIFKVEWVEEVNSSVIWGLWWEMGLWGLSSQLGEGRKEEWVLCVKGIHVVLQTHTKEMSRGQYAREDGPELDPRTTDCCHSFPWPLPNGVRQSEVSCRAAGITNPRQHRILKQYSSHLLISCVHKGLVWLLVLVFLQKSPSSSFCSHCVSQGYDWVVLIGPWSVWVPSLPLTHSCCGDAAPVQGVRSVSPEESCSPAL